jgi:transketolase
MGTGFKTSMKSEFYYKVGGKEMVTRQTLANALRALSMDAVQQANSGHPGMPMGMADIAEVLWNDFLKFNPKNPGWINRDRFVLSNGHGSMLQYALLHLAGYEVSLDEIKAFRQLHSITPGHPEYGMTPGVETTTGPLGQGLATCVGMALAEALLANEFNRPGHEIIDYRTYCFLGDGCLMEGISHEAASLAGTLGLKKLICIWDDNDISIDGNIKGWFTDNTPARFNAYGWNVIEGVDGHNAEAIQNAIQSAQSSEQPTLICCKTTIGFGAPNKAGTAGAHGAPLGEAEIKLAREKLAWPYAAFEIPDDVYTAWDKRAQGEQLEQTWQQQYQAYAKAFPEQAAQLLQRFVANDEPNEQLMDLAKKLQKSAETVATRKSSLKAIETLIENCPELIGGSADLSGSNCTLAKTAKVIQAQQLSGNYIHYGVREFAMAAIMNGLALSGFTPFGGTFLTFTDYARNAVRLSALMKLKVIHVYSHDSIGLGEDGPTHQPIEHAAMLRLTPGLDVWRPADGVETAIAWQQALAASHPSCLLLSRQNLPTQARTNEQLLQIQQGGYVLYEQSEKVEAILIATGSEVALAVEAAKALAKEGTAVRVVSMPCCEAFLRQDAGYREQVLPSAIKARLAIEAGVSHYWWPFVGEQGKVLGIDGFGDSAPSEDLFKKFGFTLENVMSCVKKIVQKEYELI